MALIMTKSPTVLRAACDVDRAHHHADVMPDGEDRRLPGIEHASEV
jgi:hypothetical protein